MYGFGAAPMDDCRGPCECVYVCAVFVCCVYVCVDGWVLCTM